VKDIESKTCPERSRRIENRKLVLSHALSVVEGIVEGSKILWIALVSVIAALAWLTASPVAAQSPNIDDEVNRIAKTLYCPVCPNTPLDVCGTAACLQWRAVIKDKLLKGESERQIRDYFVAQYGEVVLGAPPAQGFNWVAYLLPAAGILLGAAIAWFTARQWLVRAQSSRPSAERVESTRPPGTSAIPKEYAERIAKDLKEY
jgi:cytochrome c-type biogenesis protein CcmH